MVTDVHQWVDNTSDLPYQFKMFSFQLFYNLLTAYFQMLLSSNRCRFLSQSELICTCLWLCMECGNCVSIAFAYPIYISKWLNCFESISQCGVFCNLGLMFKMPGIYRKIKRTTCSWHSIKHKRKMKLLPNRANLQLALFTDTYMPYITINI